MSIVKSMASAITCFSPKGTMEMHKELQNTMVLRHYFNDLIVKKCAKYAVTYFDRSHERHTVFIAETGVMSAAPFGYNALSPELVANFEELQAFFGDEFKKYDLPFSLDKVDH